MRILQITHQYPPHHIGGVELLTRQLSRDLAQRGHEVHVLTRAPDDHGDNIENGVTVHRLPETASPSRRFLATFGDAATLAACNRILDDLRPDVIYLQHLMGYPIALVNAIRKRNIPYLVFLHDYWFACANANLITNFDQQLCEGPHGNNCGRCAAARAGLQAGFTNRLGGAALTPLLRNRNAQLRPVLKHARAVVAHSTFVAQWLRRQIPGQSVQVIEAGLDLSVCEPIRDELDEIAVQREQRQRAPSVPDTARPLRCAYIGSLAQIKGVHVLIEAFNKLPQDYQLVVAGDPTAFPDYAAQLQRAATHPNIHFVGALDRTNVWKLLVHSDVVIVPSLVHETFSLVAREALVAGCHVIASNLGALSELINANPERGTLISANAPIALRNALQQLQPIANPAPWRSQTDYVNDIEALMQ